MTANDKPSILIVDDDKNNIDVLVNILKQDYSLMMAKSGVQALKAACERKPDLILLDVLMPEMDGFSVLSQLKELPELRETRVIFITGLKSIEDEEKGFRIGAVDYITKPFHPTIIKARIKNQIDTVQHIRTIAEIAKIDALTGLPNKRSFNEHIELEWNIALTNALPLGLIMVDADKFKLYNDTFGHPQGDILLKNLGKTFKSVLTRQMDFPARIGGEEFSFILSNTQIAEATEIAERIRASVEALKIPHPNSPVASVVTISVGVTSIVPNANLSVACLLETCDRNLYTAKNTGRNKVCSS